MTYVVFVGVAAFLFGAFLLITHFEAERGKRFFSRARTNLDTRVGHVAFVLHHVDFNSFLREQFKMLAAHIAHDLAHLFLNTARSVERLLTRAVKHLRTQHNIAPAASAAPRAFVKTMRDFKEQLATTRPSYPEIS